MSDFITIVDFQTKLLAIYYKDPYEKNMSSLVYFILINYSKLEYFCFQGCDHDDNNHNVTTDTKMCSIRFI